MSGSDQRHASSLHTAKPKRKIKVLGLDGAKVHDFLFHVALAEVQWHDLAGGSSGQISTLVQNHRSRNRASILYDEFLQACSAGPNQAIAFLAKQHNLQRMYLQRSQALIQSSQLQMAKNEVVLSQAVLGVQAVKSVATLGVAIIGMFLAGPEIILGAGIGLAFDSSMEMVNRLGEPSADAVVVGFKQTVATDVVSMAGSTQQVGFDTAKQIMEKTLTYPMKSSVFRSTAETAAQLNRLMITLGIISAGVTLYTEGSATWGSYEQMIKAQNYYSSLQNQPQ